VASDHMTPERWRQVTEVFHSARARDAAARAPYLEHLRGRPRPCARKSTPCSPPITTPEGSVTDR
jgi:hypothetical protein